MRAALAQVCFPACTLKLLIVCLDGLAELIMSGMQALHEHMAALGLASPAAPQEDPFGKSTSWAA